MQATQAWLAVQPAATISIQLMGSGQPDQLWRELKNLGMILEMDNIYVYRTRSNGKPTIAVLYGTFSGREAAIKALRALPKSLRANQPRLRTVGGVLEEVKQSL